MTVIDPDIRSLLDQESFKPLTNFFSGHLRALSSKQLLSADHDFVLNITNDAELRVLLSIFLEELEQRVASRAIIESAIKEKPFGLMVDLRGKVRSCVYEKPNATHEKTHLFSTDLVTQLNSVKIVETKETQQVVVDLSENLLQDKDMAHIARFVNKLVHRNSNSKVTIDLSFNRFFGLFEDTRTVLDDNLTNLLEIPQVVNINICNNPLASLDRHDFYNKLFLIENCEFMQKKLIFIPFEWLSGGGWQALVPKKYHEKFVGWHNTFYENKKKQ